MSVGFVSRLACPLCRAEDSAAPVCELSFDQAPMAEFLQRFYAGRLAPEALGGATYRVVECARCGFVYQQNILDDDAMHTLYEEWIDAAASLRRKQAAKDRLMRRDTGQVRTLARMIRGLSRAPRVLDFGMGWGYWARAAQDFGFEVSGYEVSPRRREHAHAMGLAVIDALPPPGAHFDCIYAGQVFEHLPEPRRTLETLCARLAPGGLVYLRVPDGRGVVSRLRRDGWSAELDAVHPLEHINCFTRKTLIALAAHAGLEPVRAPLRLGLRGLIAGLRREFTDRYLTTHVHFRLRN